MDLYCPYCEAPQTVNHDDGEGYEEDTLHQMQCSECEKWFVFQTVISYSYYPEKAECLNDEQHNWKITDTRPRAWSQMECSMCGERRELTPEEKTQYNIGEKSDYFEQLKNS
jgi:hypothetical protein